MPDPRPTANDRFKEGNGARTWGAIAVAALVHFAMLALWPATTPKPLAAQPPREIAVTPPPDVPIPPEPDAVRRPAAPVVTVDAPLDISIPPTVGPRPPTLPPPPRKDEGGVDPGEMVPYTVRPELVNRDAMVRELRRRYPASLRDAGIEGTTVLWVHVSDAGRVMAARVSESSGMAAFDAAALKVAGTMEFKPALNYDRRVAVWVQIPVRFQIR